MKQVVEAEATPARAAPRINMTFRQVVSQLLELKHACRMNPRTLAHSHLVSIASCACFHIRLEARVFFCYHRQLALA